MAKPALLAACYLAVLQVLCVFAARPIEDEIEMNAALGRESTSDQVGRSEHFQDYSAKERIWGDAVDSSQLQLKDVGVRISDSGKAAAAHNTSYAALLHDIMAAATARNPTATAFQQQQEQESVGEDAVSTRSGKADFGQDLQPYNPMQAKEMLEAWLATPDSFQSGAAWRKLFTAASNVLGTVREDRMHLFVNLLQSITLHVEKMDEIGAEVADFLGKGRHDQARRGMEHIVEHFLRVDKQALEDDNAGTLVKLILQLLAVPAKGKNAVTDPQYFVNMCYKRPVFGKKFEEFYKRGQTRLPEIVAQTPRGFVGKIMNLARSFDAQSLTDILVTGIAVEGKHGGPPGPPRDLVESIENTQAILKDWIPNARTLTASAWSRPS
mmetsp:Transcript_22088/g.51518  ORF Transcript_22088/g.51518 Transcript_22088/m.51518 type:complete len:382 (+) Transcript_22088:96-1241(+)